MVVRTGEFGVQLGPLTTTWTMPESCSVFALDCPTCTSGYGGQKCGLRTLTADETTTTTYQTTGWIQDNAACWPPITKGAEVKAHPFAGWGFYSPGLACPAGYTTACTAEYGKRAQWEIQFTLDAGETAVGCCPTGFRCANQHGNTCLADVTKGMATTVTTALCDGAQLASIGPGAFPDIITTTSKDNIETVTREMHLAAPMFQLNYKLTDLSITLTSGSTSTPTASTSEATNTNPTPGLSTGAVAGVGIGAALGGIILGVVATWLLLRKRRQNATAATAAAAAGEAEQVSYTDHKYDDYTRQARTELACHHGVSQLWTPPAEMAASPFPQYQYPASDARPH